jgi:polygalacturonase
MIGLDDCTRVLIEDITLKNSPKFHIAVRGQELTVSKVTVRAPSSKDPVNPSHNTDACNYSVEICSGEL